MLFLIVSNVCISQVKDSVKVSYNAGEWALHRLYQCEEVDAENIKLEADKDLAIKGILYYKDLYEKELFLRLKSEKLLPSAKTVITKTENELFVKKSEFLLLTNKNKNLQKKLDKKIFISFNLNYGLNLVSTFNFTPNIGIGISRVLFRL